MVEGLLTLEPTPESCPPPPPARAAMVVVEPPGAGCRQANIPIRLILPPEGAASQVSCPACTLC